MGSALRQVHKPGAKAGVPRLITTYANQGVKLSYDDHCGKGRPTIIIHLAGLPHDEIRKANRELAEYGLELVK